MRLRQTRVRVVDPSRPDPTIIAEAAETIQRGGLVAFPTETVYGLGANALDPDAVAAIFEAKGRPSTDPLIVHLRQLGDLSVVVASVPAAAVPLAARFWPGPLTLVCPKGPRVPAVVTAGLDSVAVRVPAHPVARALLEAAALPIAAPSANLFSRPSPTRAQHVLADLDGRVDLVLDAGPTDVGLESTVLDLTVSPPLVRRPGGVPVEAVRAVLPTVAVSRDIVGADQAQLAPGQLSRHYAPRARLWLIEGPPEAVHAFLATEARTRVAAGQAVGVLAPAEDIAALEASVAGLRPSGRLRLQAYGARGDVARAGHELFEALRRVDDIDIGAILAVAPDPIGLGLAIYDRLSRAAEGRVIRV